MGATVETVQSGLYSLDVLTYVRDLKEPTLNHLGELVGASYFIDRGKEQLVFEVDGGQNVEKIQIPTLGSTAEEAGQWTEYLQGVHNLAAYYLGDFFVETKFRPIKLPGMIENYAVSAQQPKLQPVKLMVGPEDIWEHDDSKEYKKHQWELLCRIRELYNHTGMFPDILGMGNVMMVAGEECDQIKVVDTIPDAPKRLSHPISEGSEMTRDTAYKIVISWWLDALGVPK